MERGYPCQGSEKFSLRKSYLLHWCENSLSPLVDSLELEVRLLGGGISAGMLPAAERKWHVRWCEGWDSGKVWPRQLVVHGVGWSSRKVVL